jgi:hypothetical protein
MNTKQLDYLIEETLAAICELDNIAADSEACVHARNVHSMLAYLRAKLDVQLYGDDIPKELR